jgi:uncharacterized UBP type Zn finger protein
MTLCEHLDLIDPGVTATPADVCPDCVAAGTQWVHLRRCLVCGHVGCCDNSPMRHARAHWNSTGHPVIRSAQPGEEWVWCYIDEVYLS